MKIFSISETIWVDNLQSRPAIWRHVPPIEKVNLKAICWHYCHNFYWFNIFREMKTFSSLIFLWHGYCSVVKQMSWNIFIRHLPSNFDPTTRNCLQIEALIWNSLWLGETALIILSIFQHNFIIIVMDSNL